MRDFFDFILSDKVYLGSFITMAVLVVILVVLIIKLSRGGKSSSQISTMQNKNNKYKENVQNREKQIQFVNINSKEEELKTECIASNNVNIDNKNSNTENLSSDPAEIPVLDSKVKAEIIESIKPDNKVYETEALNIEDPKPSVGETVVLSESKPKCLATLTYEENQQIKECQIFNSIINIGRDPEACDITISSDNHIGRKHALIYSKENKFYLTDLNSKNGTYINGDRIQGERQIYHGDIIKLATTELVFKIC